MLPMKSISPPPPPLFQSLRRRNDGAGLYGPTTCRSVKILAKKKSNNNNNNNPRPPPSPGSNVPPPRITSNLKHNLPIIKVLKESEKKKSTPLRPSRYRRKRVDNKEIDLSDNPPTTPDSLDSDIDEKEVGPKVLFVDGYNVCGYWPKLKTEFISGKLAIAREMLIKDLAIFNNMNEMEVVVVFDAMKSGHRTRKEQYDGVVVVYSGETSADFWIHKEVKRVMEGETTNVTVATSDRAMMHETHFKGAAVWSCETLVSEIEAAHKEMEISNKRASILAKARRGSLLKNVLPPNVRDDLKGLKKKMLLQEMKRHTEIARAKSMDSSKIRRPKIKVSASRHHHERREAQLKLDLYIESGGKLPTEPGEFCIVDGKIIMEPRKLRFENDDNIRVENE